MKQFLIYIFIMAAFLSCNREKNITVELPPYANQPVVELYIQPGKPFRLLLTESAGYFDPPQVTPVEGAKVQVTHAGVTYNLHPLIFGLDPKIKKYFNYSTDTSIVAPEEFDNDFYLSITDKKGRTIEGRTTITKPVKIDTITFFTDDPEKAAILVKFTDNPHTKDYYRIVATQDSITGGTKWDAVFNDDSFQSQESGIGSSYIFFKGSKIVVQLIHISKEYYDFYVSTRDAFDSNGNPFAQPSTIKSNVSGGIGIVTGFTPTSKTLIVQ